MDNNRGNSERPDYVLCPEQAADGYELKRTKAEIPVIQQDLRKEVERLKRTRQEIAVTVQEVQRTKEDFNRTKEELKRTIEELNRTKEELNRTKQELNRTKAELNRTKYESTRTKDEFAEKELELVKAHEEIASKDIVIAGLQKGIERLEESSRNAFSNEQINFARLLCAQNEVGGNALRKILLDSVPREDVKHAIKLHGIKNIPDITPDQIKILKKGNVYTFDISLLYKVIRHVTALPRHTNRWGCAPVENPRDASLAASVERIRIFRNKDCSHSPKTELSNGRYVILLQEWTTIIQDIDKKLTGNEFEKQLGSVLNKHMGQGAARDVIDAFQNNVEVRLKEIQTDMKEDLSTTSETLESKLNSIMSGTDKDVRILDSIGDLSKNIKDFVDRRFAQIEAGMSKNVEVLLKEIQTDMKEDLSKTSEKLDCKLKAIMSGKDKDVHMLDSIGDLRKNIKEFVDRRFAQIEVRMSKNEQHTTECKDTLAAVVTSKQAENSKALGENSKALEEWVKHLNTKEDRLEEHLKYIIDYINETGHQTSSDYDQD